MLLEVCNLGNEKDRSLIQTKRYRQQLAQAIYEGLLHFFEEQEVEPSLLAATAK